VVNKPPNKYFGKLTLPTINEEIVDTVSKCFKYAPIKDHPWNTFMKENLQENEDYLIVDKEIWTFFTTYYHSQPIVRMSNGAGPEK
jgi:ubiquitin carboxyl-terminal hydrolase 4/11/15